ncbi:MULTISPECIES: ABC transporter permease [unclassified Kitasatospora]|uniref:ABC transporter permease n=1 Tax=unclassified Kitasatospora TaxID=2633591 RepID=UPI001AE01FF1|nr:ABC transporter permease [Kitasatospora sp. RG8]MBP0451125.1 ABC transporter permease [Kitasatospora sp. RG8]
MTSLVQPLRVVAYSARNAAADFAATYTWKSWTFGWVGRMLSQVVFFTLAGQVLGSPGHSQARFIGNSVMTCVIESMMVVASSVWERRAGTLPLLVASPAELAPVFFGRSLQWIASGVATSSVALLALGPLFGLHWSAAQIPAVIILQLLTAVASYCFGLVLSVLVLNAAQLRNIASNVAYLAMMTFCGIQVPVDYWPGPIRLLAEAMPVTYGNRAMTALAAGSPAGQVWRPAAAVVLVGAVWLGIAVLAFHFFAERGRRDGSLEFGQ